MMSRGSLMWEWVRTIKGEDNRASRLLLLSSGCFDTSVWVFRKPQTLYFGCLCAPWVGSISRMHSVVCFSISMHPDLFGGLLSYCDFIYLTVTRQTTTFSPGTWYRVKHRSQPFGSELWGQDKLLVWCESLPVYLVYLCHPTKCGPVTFLASLGGLHTSAPFLPRGESQIWFSSGSCNGVATVP